LQYRIQFFVEGPFDELTVPSVTALDANGDTVEISVGGCSFDGAQALMRWVESEVVAMEHRYGSQLSFLD
jgi:hypothetical protein